MYVFLICLPCCKRTWCENRLWFKHLLNVLHPYTHTHTHKHTHTGTLIKLSTHAKKSLGFNTWALSVWWCCFLCVVAGKLNENEKSTNKEKKNRKFPQSLWALKHTRTHTHTILHTCRTQCPFNVFVTVSCCCFCPPCSCSCWCCRYCCCRPSQEIFPVYTMTKQEKTETPAPLSHNVFVDLFILVCGRVKMVYAIRESRWKGLKIDWTGFNRQEHLWWKNTSAGNLWKNLRSLERKANFHLTIGCTTILLLFSCDLFLWFLLLKFIICRTFWLTALLIILKAHSKRFS